MNSVKVLGVDWDLKSTGRSHYHRTGRTQMHARWYSIDQPEGIIDCRTPLESHKVILYNLKRSSLSTASTSVTFLPKVPLFSAFLKNLERAAMMA